MNTSILNVPIIPISFIPFQISEFPSRTKYKDSIKKHLQETLGGKTVINKETGKEIRFYNQGFKKIAHVTSGDFGALVACNISELIENAVFADQVEDKERRDEILSVIRFIVRVSINESIYEAWIYIRERIEGYFLYSVSIDIKKRLQN